MDFCLLLKIRVKILLEIEIKTWAVNKVKNPFLMLNNLLQIHLKLFQKTSATLSKNDVLVKYFIFYFEACRTILTL